MHSSLPVTPSDKKRSKRHLKARIKLLKASEKMNKAHGREHAVAGKQATKDIQTAKSRLETVKRM